MARVNEVMIYGQVLNIRIIKDDDGNYTQGHFSMVILRGKRDTGENLLTLQYDYPTVSTAVPRIIKQMEKIKINDMVIVKGTLTTRDVNRTFSCPSCGKPHTKKGTLAFINPLHVMITETGLKPDECIDRLKEHNEISNCVRLLGKLTENPQVYKTESNLVITQYRMAVKRKVPIKDDAIESRTDFPHIKAFKQIAISNGNALREGSIIYLDGCIQTREFPDKRECTCGCVFERKAFTVDVIPYSVEYLKDYIKKEEYEDSDTVTHNVIAKKQDDIDIKDITSDSMSENDDEIEFN